MSPAVSHPHPSERPHARPPFRPLLTWPRLFDSYLTMNPSQTAAPTELAPGQFDRIAKALADPRRFAMLQSIANDEECPYQRLCADFPVTKATVSHHMKELIAAGLVEAERDGQCMVARFKREVLEAYRAELQRRLTG